jgi:hypothetical protein
MQYTQKQQIKLIQSSVKLDSLARANRVVSQERGLFEGATPDRNIPLLRCTYAGFVHHMETQSTSYYLEE